MNSVFQVKIEKETDVPRLQSLFKLCKAVLNVRSLFLALVRVFNRASFQIKALQADTAIEEGERMMRARTETGNEEAKLLQEIEELKEQISTLRVCLDLSRVWSSSYGLL